MKGWLLLTLLLTGFASVSNYKQTHSADKSGSDSDIDPTARSGKKPVEANLGTEKTNKKQTC